MARVTASAPPVTCNAQTRIGSKHFICDLELGHLVTGQDHGAWSGAERVEWKEGAW